MALTLTRDERTELERRATGRTVRAEDANRAKVILMLADEVPYSTIEATLWCYRDYINRWRRRFVAARLDGLQSRHQGQKPTVFTPALEARVLAKTQQRPANGSTHWTTRKLARVLKIHHNHVQTAWTRAGLKPHRFERDMQSDDPHVEPKAAESATTRPLAAEAALVSRVGHLGDVRGCAVARWRRCVDDEIAAFH
jgi:hypothetical protein